MMSIAGDWCNLEKVDWECLESFAITICQAAADQNANLGDDRHLAAPTRKCASARR